jgi:hypothetical protein
MVVRGACGHRTNSATNMVRTFFSLVSAKNLFGPLLIYLTAAMPSLHFGYSLLIGLTIMTIPLPPPQRKSQVYSIFGTRIHVSPPSIARPACILLGVLYPLIILVAIVATANHFILDAVAGAFVCGLAWRGNHLLLNLLPLEDWFLWCIRVHFLERRGFQ